MGDKSCTISSVKSYCSSDRRWSHFWCDGMYRNSRVQSCLVHPNQSDITKLMQSV